MVLDPVACKRPHNIRVIPVWERKMVPFTVHHRLAILQPKKLLSSP